MYIILIGSSDNMFNCLRSLDTLCPICHFGTIWMQVGISLTLIIWGKLLLSYMGGGGTS